MVSADWHMLGRLGPGQQRVLLDLVWNGEGRPEEIARRVGVDERTVREALYTLTRWEFAARLGDGTHRLARRYTLALQAASQDFRKNQVPPVRTLETYTLLQGIERPCNIGEICQMTDRNRRQIGRDLHRLRQSGHVLQLSQGWWATLETSRVSHALPSLPRRSGELLGIVNRHPTSATVAAERLNVSRQRLHEIAQPLVRHGFVKKKREGRKIVFHDMTKTQNQTVPVDR